MFAIIISWYCGSLNLTKPNLTSVWSTVTWGRNSFSSLSILFNNSSCTFLNFVWSITLISDLNTPLTEILPFWDIFASFVIFENISKKILELEIITRFMITYSKIHMASVCSLINTSAPVQNPICPCRGPCFLACIESVRIQIVFIRRGKCDICFIIVLKFTIYLNNLEIPSNHQILKKEFLLILNSNHFKTLDISNFNLTEHCMK